MRHGVPLVLVQAQNSCMRQDVSLVFGLGSKFLCAAGCVTYFGPGVMVQPTELPGGVKDRSITQPRVKLIAFSPSWNGGIFV